MATKMRAKMELNSVKKMSWGGEELEFSAVTNGTKEDNSFSEATPSAKLTMTVTNKELHGQLVPGEKYYVDFTPAI